MDYNFYMFAWSVYPSFVFIIYFLLAIGSRHRKERFPDLKNNLLNVIKMFILSLYIIVCLSVTRLLFIVCTYMRVDMNTCLCCQKQTAKKNNFDRVLLLVPLCSKEKGDGKCKKLDSVK